MEAQNPSPPPSESNPSTEAPSQPPAPEEVKPEPKPELEPVPKLTEEDSKPESVPKPAEDPKPEPKPAQEEPKPESKPAEQDESKQESKHAEQEEPPKKEAEAAYVPSKDQLYAAAYLNQSLEFIYSMEDQFPCLLPVPVDSPVPAMLYQLAYDFDQAVNERFHEHKVWYSIIDGTLLGVERHRGSLPWDDDIDVITECPGPGAPCWEQWYDPQSILRKSLRKRGLEVTEMNSDSVRHMLKVYSTIPGHYLSGIPGSPVTHPSIDVFVHRRLRCNVTDHAKTTKHGPVLGTDPTDENVRRKFEIYESDVLAYLTRPSIIEIDEATGEQKGECSMQVHDVSLVIMSEVFPLRRVRFGEVDMWGPAKGEQIVRRNLGHAWKHGLTRTFISHQTSPSEEELKQLRAKGLPIPDFSQPIQPRARDGSALFPPDQGSCRVDLVQLPPQSPEALAWIYRPALPVDQVRREQGVPQYGTELLAQDPEAIGVPKPPPVVPGPRAPNVTYSRRF